MLGREDHVFHAGRPGEGHPFLGVEFDRVELLIEVVVDLDRDLALALYAAPLPAARPADLCSPQADRAPMDEHAEVHVLPLLERGLVGLRLWTGFAAPRDLGGNNDDSGDQDEGQEKEYFLREFSGSHGNLLYRENFFPAGEA